MYSTEKNKKETYDNSDYKARIFKLIETPYTLNKNGRTKKGYNVQVIFMWSRNIILELKRLIRT